MKYVLKFIWLLVQFGRHEQFKIEHFGYVSCFQIEDLFHLLSPFIPTREVTFIRICKQVDSDLTAVVDVSVVHEGDNAQRYPFGLLVKKLEGGKSHVTWFERTEYNDNAMEENSNLYDFLGEGSGFGA